MADMCTDNRFEVIEEYKQKLIECTNIETAQDEMAVIDNILLRFWQMGWLPVTQPERKMGHWIEKDDGWDGVYYECSVCGEPYTLIDGLPSDNKYNYCPNCGTQMIQEGEDNDE